MYKECSLTIPESHNVLLMKSYKDNYRIIEWFGLEGTIKGHLVQSPCSEQGYLLLDQVAQSPVQPGLECFQGWGFYHLSGQPLPMFHHLHHKTFVPFVPFIHSESPIF